MVLILKIWSKLATVDISWIFNMTPSTWNYVDPELSYDHFGEASESMF